ncbi:MAG TPA: prenyltransferase/squalene oxidase repeat-containing protein, partial [Polyangiaceae bacterium]
MDVRQSQIRELGSPFDPDELDGAIGLARGMILERQKADGSWQERGDMGPFTTALSLVCLRHVGQLRADELREGTRWLRSRQLEDGSFVGRPFASEGDLSATGAGWAALSLGEGEENRAAAARARAFVESHGGLAALTALAVSGDLSALLLAMVGLLDPVRVTTLPLALVLVPRLLELLSRRVVFYGLTTMISCSLVAQGLETPQKSHAAKSLRRAFASRERSRALELLTLYQNRNGSLMNVVYHTALLLPALQVAGIAASDPRFANAVAWLRARGASDEHGLHFDVYGSDVWSTASYLRTLLITGSPRNDEAVSRAVTWLLDQQCTRPHPGLTNPKPGAPRVGGWGFQAEEEAYPDCDTTSTVLEALARALMPDSPSDVALAPSLATRVCASIAAARGWLHAMQNPDGGWPSFFWGHPTKRPGPIMLRPLSLRWSDLPHDNPTAFVQAITEASEHLSDPSTEDVTSRVLIALARTGTTLQAAEARRALDFLTEQQCPSGAWWGRWKVNYLPVTASVVTAFARLGDDLSKDATRRALRWIGSRQNADGGFGETIESYRDP